MGLRIPPLQFKIMLESNPLKSRILVRRLAVIAVHSWQNPGAGRLRDSRGSQGYCVKDTVNGLQFAETKNTNLLEQEIYGRIAKWFVER